MTPTMKTTEFWIAGLAPLLGGIALIALSIFGNKPELMNTGMLLMSAGAASYGVSRGLAKIGSAAPAEPTDPKSAADVVAKT